MPVSRGTPRLHAGGSDAATPRPLAGESPSNDKPSSGTCGLTARSMAHCAGELTVLAILPDERALAHTWDAAGEYTKGGVIYLN